MMGPKAKKSSRDKKAEHVSPKNKKDSSPKQSKQMLAYRARTSIPLTMASLKSLKEGMSPEARRRLVSVTENKQRRQGFRLMERLEDVMDRISQTLVDFGVDPSLPSASENLDKSPLPMFFGPSSDYYGDEFDVKERVQQLRDQTNVMTILQDYSMNIEKRETLLNELAHWFNRTETAVEQIVEVTEKEHTKDQDEQLESTLIAEITFAEELSNRVGALGQKLLKHIELKAKRKAAAARRGKSVQYKFKDESSMIADFELFEQACNEVAFVMDRSLRQLRTQVAKQDLRSAMHQFKAVCNVAVKDHEQLMKDEGSMVGKAKEVQRLHKELNVLEKRQHTEDHRLTALQMHGSSLHERLMQAELERDELALKCKQQRILIEEHIPNASEMGIYQRPYHDRLTALPQFPVSARSEGDQSSLDFIVPEGLQLGQLHPGSSYLTPYPFSPQQIHLSGLSPQLQTSTPSEDFSVPTVQAVGEVKSEGYDELLPRTAINKKKQRQRERGDDYPTLKSRRSRKKSTAEEFAGKLDTEERGRAMKRLDKQRLAVTDSEFELRVGASGSDGAELEEWLRMERADTRTSDEASTRRSSVVPGDVPRDIPHDIHRDEMRLHRKKDGGKRKQAAEVKQQQKMVMDSGTRRQKHLLDSERRRQHGQMEDSAWEEDEEGPRAYKQIRSKDEDYEEVSGAHRRVGVGGTARHEDYEGGSRTRRQRHVDDFTRDEGHAKGSRRHRMKDIDDSDRQESYEEEYSSDGSRRHHKKRAGVSRRLEDGKYTESRRHKQLEEFFRREGVPYPEGTGGGGRSTKSKQGEAFKVPSIAYTVVDDEGTERTTISEQPSDYLTSTESSDQRIRGSPTGKPFPEHGKRKGDDLASAPSAASTPRITGGKKQVGDVSEVPVDVGSAKKIEDTEKLKLQTEIDELRNLVEAKTEHIAVQEETIKQLTDNVKVAIDTIAKSGKEKKNLRIEIAEKGQLQMGIARLQKHYDLQAMRIHNYKLEQKKSQQQAVHQMKREKRSQFVNTVRQCSHMLKALNQFKVGIALILERENLINEAAAIMEVPNLTTENVPQDSNDLLMAMSKNAIKFLSLLEKRLNNSIKTWQKSATTATTEEKRRTSSTMATAVQKVRSASQFLVDQMKNMKNEFTQTTDSDHMMTHGIDTQKMTTEAEQQNYDQLKHRLEKMLKEFTSAMTTLNEPDDVLHVCSVKYAFKEDIEDMHMKLPRSQAYRRNLQILKKAAKENKISTGLYELIMEVIKQAEHLTARKTPMFFAHYLQIRRLLAVKAELQNELQAILEESIQDFREKEKTAEMLRNVTARIEKVKETCNTERTELLKMEDYFQHHASNLLRQVAKNTSLPLVKASIDGLAVRIPTGQPKPEKLTFCRAKKQRIVPHLPPMHSELRGHSMRQTVPPPEMWRVNAPTKPSHRTAVEMPRMLEMDLTWRRNRKVQLPLGHVQFVDIDHLRTKLDRFSLPPLVQKPVEAADSSGYPSLSQSTLFNMTETFSSNDTADLQASILSLFSDHTF